MTVKVCKCGHNHISWVGDLEGEGHEEQIIGCEMCDCENFEEIKT